MEACHANKVKRVVITSSVAAILECRPEDRPIDGLFSEKNWSNPVGDHIDGYSKSKTLAEQAAWEFQRSLPDEEKFEVVTINPGLILGPAFVGAGFNTGELVSNIMESKYPGVPKVMIPLVGVTEVAEAHLQALKRPEAANKRFALVNDSVWFQQVVTALANEFHPQGYNFSTKELQRCLVNVGAWFKPELKHALRMWGLPTTFDNSQSREVLGVQYGDMNKIVVEMTYSMFETGALRDRRRVVGGAAVNCLKK